MTAALNPSKTLEVPHNHFYLCLNLEQIFLEQLLSAVESRGTANGLFQSRLSRSIRTHKTTEGGRSRLRCDAASFVLVDVRCRARQAGVAQGRSLKKIDTACYVVLR